MIEKMALCGPHDFDLPWWSPQADQHRSLRGTKADSVQENQSNFR